MSGRKSRQFAPAPSFVRLTELTDEGQSVEFARMNEREENRPRENALLTEAQEAMVKRATETGNLRQAIREERPEVTTQRIAQIESQIEAKTRDVMDRVGLRDIELIENCLKPALVANEIRFFPMATDADPTHIEERTTVAWGPRLRALDVAFQLRGSYPPRNANLEIGVELSLADEVRKARIRIATRQGD